MNRLDGIFKTGQLSCPTCGYESNMAASHESRVREPKADDWALCLDCGAINCYTVAADGQVGLRAATAGELAVIPVELVDLHVRVLERGRLSPKGRK